MLTARQGVALAIQAKLNVPEFLIMESYTDESQKDIQTDPGYEIIEDIAVPVSEIQFDQVIFIKDGVHYPTLFINDNALLNGSMGAKLPANLVTAFPGQVLKTRLLQNIERLLPDAGYLTISLSLFPDGLYYKHMSIGLVPDYIPHIQALHNEESPEWFHYNLIGLKLEKQEGMSVSCRLFSYPYGEDNFEIVNQFTELNPIPLADSCHMAFRHSKRPHIKNLWRDLYKPLINPYYAHNGLVFRTDGEERTLKIFKAMKKAGVI